MSTTPETVIDPQTTPAADPFRYGWRYVVPKPRPARRPKAAPARNWRRDSVNWRRNSGGCGATPDRSAPVRVQAST